MFLSTHRRALIRDDLPTFDFPANTTEGVLLLINCFGLAADFINSALLTFIAAIVTYCLTARSSFCFAAGIAAYSSPPLPRIMTRSMMLST